MSSIPSVSNTTLAGYLQLECSVRTDGTPYISRQDFRAPIHIGKGHLSQGCLVMNLVNPTAGFFDGDRVDMNVQVLENAHLCLSTPAASRVYFSRSGKAATNAQRLEVGENALLEWHPEPFIPHAGASYHQSTKIQLHPTASLLFFEWLAPGRVAMGEIFAYRKLRWELDLRVGDQLVAREAYDLEPSNDSIEALRLRFPAAHYLSVWVAGKFQESWPSEELDALSNETIFLGHGPLEGGAKVIRALCADSIATRKLLAKLREMLYRGAERLPPHL